MCQMSMKLLAMFDQNAPHTLDKIVKKLITTKKLSNLDLDPKCQGHSRNHKLMTWGTKTMPPKKNLSRGCLSNWCVTPTPTRMPTPTAVKQYVDPQPDS